MDGSHPMLLWRKPWWPLAIVVVMLGQAGLALQLFGPDDSFAAMQDDRPIMNGRHPLHLYHGWLGAATFTENYSTSCYDPAFQAGYPKTPVFDGGSRPAELFLVLAGGEYSPAAYKFGVFTICLLVPVAFALAAWGTGLSSAAISLSAALGVLLTWTPPIRAQVDAGHLDLLLAGLMALILIGGLVRYAKTPEPLGWVMMALAAMVGWFAHPVAWLGLLPLVAGYYVIYAPRNGLAWHLGFFGVGAAGLVPNLWWLWDWARFWWLRQPPLDELAPLPCLVTLFGTLQEYADLLMPGLFSTIVLALGVVGIINLAREGQRVAAGLLLGSFCWIVLAARFGETWPTMASLALDRVASLALAILVLPLAALLAAWWNGSVIGRIGIIGISLLPLALGWAPRMTEPVAVLVNADLKPLALGLNEERQQMVATLKKWTTPEARILIEESEPDHLGWNWTALLPQLTDRVYLGGLDPDAAVDHSFCGMRDGKLNGRRFADWSDSERGDFCRRYNVGWVVCRSTAAVDWWSRDPDTKEIARFRDGGDVVLFALQRPHSYILRGYGLLERADRSQIVLTDLAPNAEGEVVLSFHYQMDLRVAPGVVWMEDEKDAYDPIPMLKLRLPGPISRVTLSWDSP